MPDRRHAFLALAAAFVFLSLDDAIRIHERLGDKLDSVFVENLIFAPILILAWMLAPVVGKRAGLWLRAGLVLLACAVAIDLFASYTHDLEDDGITWPQPVRVALEEGFEVAGWILIAGVLAILPALELRRPRPGLSGRNRSTWRRADH